MDHFMQILRTHNIRLERQLLLSHSPLTFTHDHCNRAILVVVVLAGAAAPCRLLPRCPVYVWHIPATITNCQGE